MWESDSWHFEGFESNGRYVKKENKEEYTYHEQDEEYLRR
jgi:hypothetical protein